MTERCLGNICSYRLNQPALYVGSLSAKSRSTGISGSAIPRRDLEAACAVKRISRLGARHVPNGPMESGCSCGSKGRGFEQRGRAWGHPSPRNAAEGDPTGSDPKGGGQRKQKDLLADITKETTCDYGEGYFVWMSRDSSIFRSV